MQDPAFLDRISRKHLIGPPCDAARYEILRQEYFKLARCGVVVGLHNYEVNDADSDSTMRDDSEKYQALDSKVLPDHDLLILEFGNSPAALLEKCAIWCKGLSGRAVAALPQDSISLYSKRYPCPISDALWALHLGIWKTCGGDPPL